MNYKGFTLVELLVVIAIIAILATVVAPNAFMAIEKAKVGTILQDGETIKKAAFLFFADTGQFPTSTISGNRPYDEWNQESTRMFITGIGQPVGWDGPYLESWPSKTPFGGCYTYRRIAPGEPGFNWAQANLRNQANQPPPQTVEMLYLRFNLDADRQSKRDKLVPLLRDKFGENLVFTTNQTADGNLGLIALVLRHQ